jgi:hypothetical protein
MKNIAFILFFAATTHTLCSQNIGISLSVGLRKTFTLNEKSSFDLRQHFQINPEIKKYNNKYGDFFNEDGFWSVPDRYRDDDELDDDDDLPPGAGNGIPDNGGELNDSPHEITFDWRSNSSFQYNYRFFPWFRSNAGYGLFYNGEEFRHTFRAELDYRPLRHSDKKRKLDLAARTLFQYVGQPDDGAMEWGASLIPRFDVDWTFKQNHIIAVSNSLNGTWDDDIFEFDRWRIYGRLVLVYEKMHRFTLGYLYQARLDKPKNTHGVNFGYEVRF